MSATHGNSIKASQIITLDSNILISGFDPHNLLHPSCRQLLEQIHQKSPQIFISVLVFQEFLVKIYSAGLEKDLSKYEDYLTANGRFTVVDVTRSIARLSAKIRSIHPSIKTPDSLHIATAIDQKTNLFLTTDTHLPKKISSLSIQTIL